MNPKQKRNTSECLAVSKCASSALPLAHVAYNHPNNMQQDLADMKLFCLWETMTNTMAWPCETGCGGGAMKHVSITLNKIPHCSRVDLCLYWYRYYDKLFGAKNKPEYHQHSWRKIYNNSKCFRKTMPSRNKKCQKQSARKPGSYI